MRIEHIERVEPRPSKCIEVDSPNRLFRVGGNRGHSIPSHNSVVQRNIVFSCIMRPDSWRFIGIDLKKVELSAYRKYSNVVLGIATELEDALTVLRFGQQTMMKRYAEMEKLGKTNFLELPEKGKALLIMVDEAGELLSPSGVKALSEKTIVKNRNGRKNLGEIQVGDTVYDNLGQETKVINKYSPERQDKYSMTISSDSSGSSENFVAGAEHYWVMQVQYPDGSYGEKETITTQQLYELQKEQLKKPQSERLKIKFKRG